MSWSAVVTMYTVTFLVSVVVLGGVFLLALDPALSRRLLCRLRRQPYYPDMAEARLYDEALRLATAVDAALQEAPIGERRRMTLRAQVAEVPTQVAATLSRLHRVREVKQDLYATPLPEAYLVQKRELAALEQELLLELRCSLEALSAVPVSLLSVEMRRDARKAKQIVDEVTDSNTRVKDLSAAWKELG